MTETLERPVTASSENASEKFEVQPGEETREIYDVTIVGGGPAGLYGAFYAGLRQMKTKILDSLPELGGQLNALYPEKYVYDMPGFPKVLARDLARDMSIQASRFDPAICLDEKVLELAYERDGIIRLTTQRATHFTRTLILATGAGAFAPTKTDAPGLVEFEGRGVHYFVKDKARFEGKRLLIVGGGDSALDWAMNLEEMASKITLAHRRDAFRAHEESVDWLLNRSQVEVLLWNEIKCVEGDTEVRSVTLFNNKTKEEMTLEVDAVLLNLGFKADIGPIRDWGVELHGSKKIVVNETMMTNLPGVYAIGDITHHEGKIDLIATGVGEAAIAVNFAKSMLDPGAKLFVHSSNLTL